MINRLFISFLALITLLFFAGCSSDSSVEEEPGEIMLKIDDYTLTKQEFNKMFRFEIEADRNFDLSGSAEVAFINELIRKQLLIQQAQKLKLDHEEAFRQTIQRYWESTLIRDLLRKKSEEFKQQTPVTGEEVRQYFDENQMDFGGQTFESVEDSIKELIEHEKISEMMNGWLDQLVDSASIKVMDPELEQKLNEQKEQGSVY